MQRVDQESEATPLRNEVDEADKTDHAAKAPTGFAVTMIAGLHVLCCGLLLPLLAGVSVATILPSRSAIGAIAALLGIAGFVWYVRKGPGHMSAQSEPRPDGPASG